MEKLMQILSELRPDVDFTQEQALIEDGVLDSFDIVSLVNELQDAYDVEISVEDLLPENFNTPASMLALISKLQEE